MSEINRNISDFSAVSLNLFNRVYLEQIRRLENSGDVVIFGAGGFGRRLLDDLKQYTLAKISVFCDNDRDLINVVIDGVEVISVETAIKIHSSAIFVITPKGYKAEMKEQLLRLGLDEDQILLIDMERRWA